MEVEIGLVQVFNSCVAKDFFTSPVSI